MQNGWGTLIGRIIVKPDLSTNNSVADPYPGSGAFLAGSEMGKVRIRIRDEQPIFINHFWVKMLEFFVADPGFGMEKILIRVYLIQIRDPGWKKFGSAIRPGSATLTSKKHFAKDLLKLCCCRGALASRHRPSGEALRAQILRRASASAMSASSSLSSFYTVRSQKIAEVCVAISVADLDPSWIRIQSGQWIRMIRIRNPDPDP
jgi:hypothetical protein